MILNKVNLKDNGKECTKIRTYENLALPVFCDLAEHYRSVNIAPKDGAKDSYNNIFTFIVFVIYKKYKVTLFKCVCGSRTSQETQVHQNLIS